MPLHLEESPREFAEPWGDFASGKFAVTQSENILPVVETEAAAEGGRGKELVTKTLVPLRLHGRNAPAVVGKSAVELRRAT